MNNAERPLQGHGTLVMDREATVPAVYFAEIPLSNLRLNSYNARRFDEGMTPQRRARFDELVDSIHRKGILEPLLVRPIDDHYEVIAGERRYRAALQVVGENEGSAEDFLAPCMVRTVDDDEAFDIMVIENLHREDLTPFETAQSFRDYLTRHGNSTDAVANLSARTGIPVHAIRRQVRLLDLPSSVVAAWKEGSLSQSHAELFTRIGDDAQVQELLSACLRSKLTVRELAERIGTIAPDLERGFFDRGECQECHFNTSVQSGLFADIAPAGKCGNAACFEAKQTGYLIEHWQQSKVAGKYGTRGFRFSHRLPPEHREVPVCAETSPRCLECDAFVSVLRLAGTVVGMYERTCVGPRVCYEELYLAAPEPREQPELPEETPDPAPATPPPAEKPAEPKKAPSKPTATEDTGPVFNALRGERFREIFFRVAIPEQATLAPESSPQVLRLILLALALAPAAKSALTARLGLEQKAQPDEIAAKVFEIPPPDLAGELRSAAVAQILDPATPAAVRRLVAERFGIDLARDWSITGDYLDALTGGEIVRIGEESGVEIWRDDRIVEYRKERHKGKALRSLKKQELIDIILKSGADLKGLVPAEVLGERKG